METITKELTIDLYGPTMRYAVEAHQGDRATRVLLITVTEDGQPFKLPVGADYIAQIKKPNRVTVYKKCTMQNNVITLTLPGNALDERGRATCDIVINDAAKDQTLTTQAFEIEIHPKQGAANSIESSDNLPSMEDQIAKNKTDIAALFKTAQNHQQTLGLHDERITILEETSVEHTQEIQEVQANVLNKIDGAYVENGYLYLTANEEVVAGPLGPFSGGGGGGSGGGSGNNATLTMNNTTGWLAKTVAHGGDCTVSVEWSSLEDDIPTGSGSMTIRVNNAVKTTRNVDQGNVSLNLAPYLGVGANAVKVSISDVYGNARTVNFSITVVAVSISSTFDASVPYYGDITFTYTPVGSVNKIVHFILDGQEVNRTTTTASGRQLSVLIPAQSHGTHAFEVYFTAEIDGEEVKSNTLYYELICVAEDGDAPVIVTSFNKKEVEQYASITIEYYVYNPVSMLAAVTLAANGETIQELPEVDRSKQTWTYRANVAGALTLTITAGETVKTIQLNVTESEIDVEAETEDLVLFLSSYGRSNGEENPAVWKYGNIAATFTGFNWVSDGWQMDEEKISVLRVAGDARLQIPIPIFETDFRGTGKTIEIEFATRDVMDYDAVILSCMSGGRGIVLTSQQATMTSEQSTIFTQYKENEHVRLTFVVEKRVENRLIYCYINGVMCGVVQYPSDDDFAQASPVGISVGSNDSTIDLYCIRVYDNNLTRFQVLNNWIADTQNGADMMDRYLRNNVFDEYSQIVVDRLPKNLPYLVLEAAELPQSKGDKKTVNGTFTHPTDTTRCFTFEGAQADVQGTSSASYARKNYKIKFKGFKNTGGGTMETFALRSGTVPTNIFTFKADVASSEGANNVELVRLYNDANPYKTPPQQADARVRQGIDGFPIVIFWSDGNVWVTTTTFCGGTLAKATWKVTATESGTITVSYKTSYNSASSHKMTVKVNEESIATDFYDSTYVEHEIAVVAGDVVTVTAEYSLISTSSYTAYNGYMKFAGTGAFTIDAEIENAKTRVFDHYIEGTGAIGGWEKAELRKKMKEIILPLIPSEVSSKIKSVSKTHTAYDTKGKSFSQTTNDDVWLPDYYEVYSGSSRIYKTLFPDNASRVKMKVGATSASWWWLRGANYNNLFYSIYSSGDWNYYYPNNSGGVALGFCT